MKLQGKKVAILATHGFEESELASPRQALLKAGAEVHIVSPDEKGQGRICSWNGADWGSYYDVDKKLEEAHEEDYDALMLPGGVLNPDALRQREDAVEFVRAFFKAGKPVGAICHGPQTLIEAGVVKGRRLTSYPSVATDLKNAGAHWVDAEVVVDEGLVTSRKPADLEAFNRKLVEEIGEGAHTGQTA